MPEAQTSSPPRSEAAPGITARWRRGLFGISPDEAHFDRRGFPGISSPARGRLETVGRTFIGGYLVALEVASIEQLPDRLAKVDEDLRGFAYEGAAMALCIRDLCTPWRRAWLPRFIAGAGDPHVYMVHVGAGWGLARVPWRIGAGRRLLDPLLASLAMDGYGFHEGYFDWRRCYEDAHRPRRLRGNDLRAFDQGLGRALWFVEGAVPGAVIARVRHLPPERHADLWSGVGLAAAYAGGADTAGLRQILDAAGELAPHVRQGAVFAARARQRAGNSGDDTEDACRALCGLAAAAAADLCEAALAAIPGRPDDSTYEQWRTRVREALVA